MKKVHALAGDMGEDEENEPDGDRGFDEDEEEELIRLEDGDPNADISATQ